MDLDYSILNTKELLAEKNTSLNFGERQEQCLKDEINEIETI